MSEKTSHAAHHHDHSFIPGLGHAKLTPLYDLVHLLSGGGRIHAEMIRQADVRHGHRVLDVGCGTGNLLLAVGRQVAGVELTGLDPDERMLGRAGGKARRKGVPVTWSQGFGQELPFADGSFDRVFSSLMLHHLEPSSAKDALLAQVRRVLAPDGVLVLADLAGNAAVRRHGFLGLGRRMRHSGMLDDNAGMVERIAGAGFAVAAPTLVSLRLGDITVVRAQPTPLADG